MFNLYEDLPITKLDPLKPLSTLEVTEYKTTYLKAAHFSGASGSPAWVTAARSNERATRSSAEAVVGSSDKAAAFFQLRYSK